MAEGGQLPGCRLPAGRSGKANCGYPSALDLIAVSHQTHWPLSDLLALEPEDLAFWVAKTAEFVEAQNKAIKKAQEKASTQSR